MKNKKFRISYIILGLIVLLAAVLFSGVHFLNLEYKIEFDELLYTLISPIDGANTSIVSSVITFALPYIIGAIVVYILIILGLRWLEKRVSSEIVIKTKKREHRINIYSFTLKLVVVVSLACACGYANNSLDITGYIYNYLHPTTLYEDYYVNPQDVSIEGENTKNVILIYLESLETTYADTKSGGYEEDNYISNLTKLANQYISFSNSTKLGGFHNTQGTTWTMGSLFAQTAGIPYSFPVDHNEMGKYESFAKGVTNLGDILDEKGYNQEFLCGSNGDFAGRKTYFEEHGNYKVFDLYSAIDAGYMTEDDIVWWGFDDELLFKIAKDEIGNLSSQDQPFNFSLLTVDTHYPSGYVCDECPDLYDNQTANVITCQDTQVSAFVKWCQTQSWYKDTTIILTGDHPRMDKETIPDGLEKYDRTMYNCFINTVYDGDKKKLNLQNREWTPMDMLPSTLSAMGFNVEGHRLGLGTDLFSDTETLCEQLTYEVLNNEIRGYSKFYTKNFG